MKMKNSTNSIGVFSYARKNSERCPNKILRNFGNTTILDILLNKFSQLDEDTFFSGYEEEFQNKCNNYGIRFLQRTKRSASIDGPALDILSFLKNVNYDYLLIVNSCLPFLKLSTIKNFLSHVKNNGYLPTAACIKRSNYFFTNNKKPINFPDDLITMNSKVVEPVLEFANALYFFNRQFFFDNNGRYWDWNKLNLYTIESEIEVIDIDTETDFLIAESIWMSNKYKN